MKTTPPDRPRFTCRLARGAIAIFGDTTTGEPRGPGSSHVAKCEDCQVYFAACDDFDLALKRDALAVAQTPSPAMEHRIMDAVKRAGMPKRRRSNTAHYLPLVSAGVAACLIAILALQRPATPTPVLVKKPIAEAGKPNSASNIDLAFSSIDPTAVSTLLETDPLQTEVDAVVSDAQAAVQFLARNFLLPSSTPPRPSNGE